MHYEISFKVASEKPGCDPEALSSLGKLASMFSEKIGTPEPERKSRLGDMAKQYGGAKKRALDLFDLRKIDLSNEYAEPDTIGERTK